MEWWHPLPWPGGHLCVKRSIVKVPYHADDLVIDKTFTRDLLANGIRPAVFLCECFIHDKRSASVRRVFIREISTCCQLHFHCRYVIVIDNINIEGTVGPFLIGVANMGPAAIAKEIVSVPRARTKFSDYY